MPGRGDKLDAWIRNTLPQALAYALSLLNDRGAAEDLVHDCYCRLLQKAAIYDLPRDGVKLLMKAISNAAINRNTRERFVLSLERLEFKVAHPSFADTRAIEPSQVAMHRELEDTIASGLGQLPLPQRAALELKSLGHSLEEIAEALEITPNHAGVLVHRARKAMADYLREKVE